MHGFGPVEPEPDEPVVPRRVGAARVRAHARDGRDRRVEPRRRRASPARTARRREYLARTLLRDLARRPRAPARRARPRERGGDRGRAPARRPEALDAVGPEAAATMLAQRRPDEPRRAAARPGSRSATACAPATCTRRATPACRATCAATSGTVELVHGCHVFPDANAHGGGEDPQWLYTVRFDGRELWGAGRRPDVAVSVDAFEPYLEPRVSDAQPPRGRAPRSPPRRRRPGVRRAVGGAGVRARRRAARARRVHLAGVGRGARRGDPARAGRRRSGHGRDVLPPLAGGARAPRRREGRGRRRDARRATPTPGGAPPTARRTARRSSSRPATSPDLSAAAPARPAGAPRRRHPPSGARPRAAASRRARGAGPRGRATASRSRAAGPGSAASA